MQFTCGNRYKALLVGAVKSCELGNIAVFVCVQIELGFGLSYYGNSSVSYTHLDVYKRQACISMAVNGTGALIRRLLDMGLTPKTRVVLRKIAPMGDPIELYLRGYELTIRKEDAAQIEIEKIKG